MVSADTRRPRLSGVPGAKNRVICCRDYLTFSSPASQFDRLRTPAPQNCRIVRLSRPINPVCLAVAARLAVGGPKRLTDLVDDDDPIVVLATRPHPNGSAPLYPDLIIS
jgi:hypothetical protein